MLVKYLLHQKGRNVEYVEATKSLASAGKRLAEKNIGAIMVCDEEHYLAGIISERDIVRIVGQHDAGILSRPVAEFMQTDVITCREEDTIEFVMNLMTRRRCRHIPVERDGVLCGLLSATDVMRSLDQMYCIADFAKDYLAAERLAA